MRIALLALVAVVALSGCGNSNSACSSPSRSSVKSALAGAAPPLAGLHARANLLIGGSKSDFQAQMAKLRGHPVVVNKWASWCGPCRGEFPLFQKAGLQLGKQVAFVGLDAQDNDGNARKFLGCLPVTYPSYRDPDLKISSGIQASIAFPTTIFFDRNGKLVYAHPGQYSKLSELITDIHRYAR